MAKSRNAKKRGRSSSARASGSRSSTMRARSTRGASARKASGLKSARGRSAGSSRGRNGSGRENAIVLLKSDHREVEHLFGEFERAGSNDQKLQLAGQICLALRTHTTIEEEIFYPAFLAATRDEDKHHEAEVEHAGAKKLIAEIEGMSPGDEYYGAKVKVLSEMIRHHVKEEEKPGGMFAEARKSHMDLDDLGQRMKARKRQLEDEGHGSRLRGATKTLLNA